MLSNLPKKTLAAVLIKQNSPLEIAEIDLPTELVVGQVLVELYYSGICGSQIGEIDGAKGPDKWLPHLLGHEASGKVIAIGPGVKTVKPGDLVIAHWRPSDGIEAQPAKYELNGLTINAGWVTTFNKYSVISENRLTTISPDTNLKTAALYGCAVTTGFGCIDNRAQVKLGETVVVFGSGGIGLNIVQAATLAGASQICAVDLFNNRLELASFCGATTCINASLNDPWMVLKNIFSNHGPDVFIDNTGNTEIIRKGYELVNSRGRVILVGVPKFGNDVSISTLPLHFGKTIIGTTGGESNPKTDIPRYMSLLRARGIDLSDLITESDSLTNVNTLIENMRSGKSAGRCLIDFSKL